MPLVGGVNVIAAHCIMRNSWHNDPFIIKEQGGDIKDRNVSGYSWRRLEGTTLGEEGVATLRRVISQSVPLWLAAVAGTVILVFVGRLVYLQSWQGAHWRNVAEGNRIRLEIIRAPRGLIEDRNRQPLLYNNSTFSVVAVPADMPKDEIQRQQLLNDLLASVPAQYINQDQVQALAQSSYLPQFIAENIPHDLALQLMVVSRDMKGISVQPSNERNYLLGPAAAHLLGYVGQISPDQYQSLKSSDYQLNDIIGQAGLEMQYENVLRGVPGKREVEVDAAGKERNIYAVQSPLPGAKLTLTIDAKLQQTAYDALSKQIGDSKHGGSVVALNPQNGEILALISYPSFDNNVFTSVRDNQKIKELLQSPLKPLLDRPLAGEYSPGSTIKPFYAAAGLKEGVITDKTTVRSTGGVRLGDQFFADWKTGGHGIVDVYKAIAESVNTFFYLLGGGSGNDTGLGISRISSYLKQFGFSQKRGIDLPGERSGFIPTPLWKVATLGERWYRGDTYNISIGQGDLLVTPLQLAVNYGGLVTNGDIYQPHLVKQITWADGQTEVTASKTLGNLGLSPEVLKIVQRGMRQTITAGSARSLNTLSVPVAGKTGTAQTGSRTPTHAWFVGYAPYDNPTFLVVVMVEYGGEGSTAAVPIARQMFEEYFSPVTAVSSGVTKTARAKNNPSLNP